MHFAGAPSASRLQDEVRALRLQEQRLLEENRQLSETVAAKNMELEDLREGNGQLQAEILKLRDQLAALASSVTFTTKEQADAAKAKLLAAAAASEKAEKLRLEAEAKAQRERDEAQKQREREAARAAEEARQASAAEAQARAEIAQDEERDLVTFTFLDADALRATEGALPFPPHDELSSRTPAVLVRRTLPKGGCYRGGFSHDTLCVAHRWESEGAPDPSGAQAAAVRAHLQQQPDIKFVWYDYSCVPRLGARPPAKSSAQRAAERVAGDWTVLNAHLLFLGASVLALIDQPFAARFWCQFELWCSLQRGTSGGLSRATKDRQRATLVCVHGAVAGEDDAALRRKWERVRPPEARTMLCKPHIGLSVASDRDAALACLDTIDGDVKAAYNKASCAALLASGSTPLTLLKLGFGSRILTAAGATVDLTDLISSGATLRKLG